MSVDIKKISTEGQNQNSLNIDVMETIDILRTINNEDQTVANSVKEELVKISDLVDAVVVSMKKGGRLIYMGAGTSGRIGLLDAVECPPTYGVSPEAVMCLLAGGDHAFVKAVEGAEDSKEFGVNDLKNIKLSSNDFVCGIAASGRTPYVIAAIEYAKSIGCQTGCIVNAKNSELAKLVDYPIEAVVGSEVIQGSTRMKSGTAQKLICNMISTASMIKMGHVYKNLMIDLKATNEKLVARQLGIIQTVTNLSKEEANVLLKKYGTVKRAIFSNLSGIENIEKIDELLNKSDNNISKALKEVYHD